MVVSKTTNKQSFSTVFVNHKFVWKAFYFWTWFVGREMICLQMFNMDFFDFPISITLIVVWMNELLVNPVFREAAHSIKLVRQPKMRICVHLTFRMQCVNRFCTECYMDDIPSEIIQKYSSGVVINTVNIKYLILLHKRFRVSQIWRSCKNSSYLFCNSTRGLRCVMFVLPHKWLQ